ncbi:MAG: thiolase family protein [Pseudonocardiaceae bacterium]|nr:MAG: thiolase family protein [Pseudonocardiaceae bacterium]
MPEGLAGRVCIAGVGCTRFGDLASAPGLAGPTLQELAAAAAREALEDAGLRGPDVGALYAGDVSLPTSHLRSTATDLAAWIGMRLSPAVHVDAAGATTSVGVGLATEAIASGVIDTALVVGVEAGRSTPRGGSPYQWDALPAGRPSGRDGTCPGRVLTTREGHDAVAADDGIVAQGYMRRHGVSAKDFDRAMFELCRTQRLHGSLDPRAILRTTLEEEAGERGFGGPFEFWQSDLNPFVAWPSRRLSTATAADGASAVVLVRTEATAGLPSRAVAVRGFAAATATAPGYLLDPTEWPHIRVATRKAYRMAGIRRADVDHLHVDDSSHVMGIVTAEQMGYLRFGDGLRAAHDGRLRFDGDRPMTTHGGRHAFGDAGAASAGSDIHHVVRQIRAEAGRAQILPPPRLAVIATHGHMAISHTLVLEGL